MSHWHTFYFWVRVAPRQRCQRDKTPEEDEALSENHSPRMAVHPHRGSLAAVTQPLQSLAEVSLSDLDL